MRLETRWTDGLVGWIDRIAGTPAEKLQASRILPLVSRHHFLLVTLLLFNSLANEVRLGYWVRFAGSRARAGKREDGSQSSIPDARFVSCFSR